MKIKYISNKWLRLCVGSAMLILFSSPGFAQEWSCTHGHSGHIEYEDRIEDTGRTHIGWGLDFVQKSGLTNWVHFAVPSQFGQQTRFIALQFLTGSVDAIVRDVHIYDLGIKVREFNDVNWTGALQSQILDLGSERAFTALGISVGIGAGVEQMSHRFWFTGACADAN